MPDISSPQEILFTRQRHEADRAGLHWDYRLVHGDKAYSWATKKELPEPGKSILLFEQPVHTSHYALSERVEIPKGSYGAGTTTLDFVRKAKLIPDEAEPGKLVIETKDGERFLLKQLPDGKYGDKAWLFKNLTKSGMTNRYLTKLSAAKASKEETDSQARDRRTAEVLKQLDDKDGVLAAWSTGSGKTLLSLRAIEAAQKAHPDKRSLFVAPASLVGNVDKEIAKHKVKIDRSKLDVMSYEMAVRRSEKLKDEDYNIAVADEAHKMRNSDTKRSKELTEVMQSAHKRLLLTATPTFNHPGDIAPLLNIAAGHEVLPNDKKKFENRYVKWVDRKKTLAETILRTKVEQVPVLQNTSSLRAAMGEHVHHYDSTEDPKAKEHFPSSTEKTIEVEMSPEQKKYYSFVEGQLPFWVRAKIRYNLPMDKSEKSELNSFSTGVRQVSTGYRHLTADGNAEFTPKINAATSSLKTRMKKDKNFRGLVYSNYLESGVKEYSKKLVEEGIHHSVYTGELNAKEKKQLVDDYNEGRTPVLLISGAGSEGLDLKGTKLVQTLGPEFNHSKTKQVMGRGVRFKSHAHLPKEERHVDIEHYHAVHPKSFFGRTPTSIDTYLAGMSKEKEDVSGQIKDLMREKTTS